MEKTYNVVKTTKITPDDCLICWDVNRNSLLAATGIDIHTCEKYDFGDDSTYMYAHEPIPANLFFPVELRTSDEKDCLDIYANDAFVGKCHKSDFLHTHEGKGFAAPFSFFDSEHGKQYLLAVLN